MKPAAFLLMLLVATPALAEDPGCLAEIDALHDGPLNPLVRTPHRVERIITEANGAVTSIWDDVIETPLRAITGIRGQQMTLILDRDCWTGPTAGGPWTLQPGQLAENRIATMTTQQAARRAGIEDAERPGLTEVDGRMLTEYRFVARWQADPA